MRRARFATYNTWKNEGGFAARLPLMAQGLAELGLEAVALQECFYCPALGLDAAGTIAAACGLVLSRAPMREKPRRHEGALVPSRADLAILSRAPPLRVRTIALPEDPRDGQRLALIADLDLAGLEVRFVCTHLTHLRDAEAAAVRRRQAEAALAAAREGARGPIVIAGDFNDPPEADSLRPLFEDAACDAGPARPGGAAAAGLMGGRIDHVLLFDAAGAARVFDRRLALDAPDAAGRTPSDHPAVVVEIGFTETDKSTA